MRILALDTCFDACSACVALARDGRVSELASAIELFQTGHAERIVPMIGEVIQRAGVSFADIDRIAVTVGPGTFTGTRIGLSAARALSLAIGIPLVGATSLEVMGHAAGSQLRATGHNADDTFAGADILIAADVRRGEVYAQVFDSSGQEARSSAQLLSVADAARIGAGLLLVAGSGAQAIATMAAESGRPSVAVLPQLLPHASALASIAAWREPAEGALQPLYLRAPDARPQEGKSIARVPV